MRAHMTAEWTKLRTVRSTGWTLALTFVITAGLGALIGIGMRNALPDMDADFRANFDPTLSGFYSLTLGQLSLVVFGVLTVTSEYASGMIRASLAAMPRRAHFYGAKVLAALSVAAVFSAVTVLITYVAAQRSLGSHGSSFSDPGVPRAILGAALYMTLMCAFSIGVATMLRSTALSLGIMLPLLFLGSQGVFNLPKVRTVAQFLPDQAGAVMMRVRPLTEHSIIQRDFGPWIGLLVMLAWTAAALIGGYVALSRRDA